MRRRSSSSADVNHVFMGSETNCPSFINQGRKGADAKFINTASGNGMSLSLLSLILRLRP